MSNLRETYIGGVLLLLTSTGLSGIVGYFKGKKVSEAGIYRKNNLYLPMIDELDILTRQKIDFFKNISLPISLDVLENNYKYSIDRKIIEKLQVLNDLILIFNDINIIRIAHAIIANQFKECFESLYGSVIDGISHNVDEFGNEYCTEHKVEELIMLESLNFDKEIKSLIMSENRSDYIIRQNESDYDYMYSDLVRIYDLSFNVTVNGKHLPKRATPLNWKGTIPEYFAYKSDFFREFNNNLDYVKKCELGEKIAELAQDVVLDLKKLVERIVCKYEKEDL